MIWALLIGLSDGHDGVGIFNDDFQYLCNWQMRFLLNFGMLRTVGCLYMERDRYERSDDFANMCNSLWAAVQRLWRLKIFSYIFWSTSLCMTGGWAGLVGERLQSYSTFYTGALRVLGSGSAGLSEALAGRTSDVMIEGHRFDEYRSSAILKKAQAAL